MYVVRTYLLNLVKLIDNERNNYVKERGFELNGKLKRRRKEKKRKEKKKKTKNVLNKNKL